MFELYTKTVLRLVGPRPRTILTLTGAIMSFGPVCQQCKEPLQVCCCCLLLLISLNRSRQIDASLIDLAPSQYDMLVASLPSPPSQGARSKPTDKLSDMSSVSKTAWRRSRRGSTSKPTLPLSSRAHKHGIPLPNESFVLLQDSVVRNIPSPTPAFYDKNANRSASTQESFADQSSRALEDDSNPSPLSHHLRSTARLFNLLSSRTEIDHPLCAECTQILLTNLQKQLDETKKERDGYIAFEKEVRKERDRESQGFSKEDTEKKIEKLKLEEELVMQQLREAEREQQQLDNELRQMAADETSLEQEEAESVGTLSFLPFCLPFGRYQGFGEHIMITSWWRSNKRLSWRH